MATKDPKVIIKYRKPPKQKRHGRRKGAGGDRQYIAAYVAGQVIGRAERGGFLARLPTVIGTDPVLNAGVIMYAARRFGLASGEWLDTGAKIAIGIGAYRAGAAGRLAGDTNNDVEV